MISQLRKKRAAVDFYTRRLDARNRQIKITRGALKRNVDRSIDTKVRVALFFSAGVIAGFVRAPWASVPRPKSQFKIITAAVWANKVARKFVSGTIDQIIHPGAQVERYDPSP